MAITIKNRFIKSIFVFLDVLLILLFYEEMNHDFNTLNAITVIFNIF
ncbi:DALR domain-containing protein [Bacillus cereus group sp. RP32]